MTQFLPPNLLALFAAREPIRYLPPADKLTHEKKRIPYSGVAEYLEHFEVRALSSRTFRFANRMRSCQGKRQRDAHMT